MVGAAALLGAGLVAVPPAQASLIGKTIAFDLTSNHCSDMAGCGAPGTVFGTVFLGQTGTDGTATTSVEVDLNAPYQFANTGSADNQAFKFNGTGVALGDITVTPQAGRTLQAQTGTFNADGTGNFTFGIACTSCGGGLSDGFSTPIDFTVANATIADLTAPNNLGNIFVADIGNSLNGATGPIDASGPGRAVPAPVLGHGLLVLLAVGGVLFGGKILENLKKRNLQAT
jgi:hypothetical protein